jgi:hypothetical protein
MLNDTRLIHHVPLSERDELLEMVGEQLASSVDPASEESAWLLYVGPPREETYLRTPALTMLPRTTGTTWVNEKPASTTSTHSGASAAPPPASVPQGTRAGPVE